MEEKKQKHNIFMEQRSKVSICGVLDVFEFDEESIITQTEEGILAIKGVNLHVSKLNLEKGELEIDGEIDCLSYNNSGFNKSKGGVLSKIFK